jgi:acyl-coenzyme A thioesterase 9
MPIRSPGLYSESLLEAQIPAPQQSDAAASHSAPLDTPPQRAMHDSYSEISLPLHADPKLLEQFINANGGIRTGKLMEHLDALAGSIAYKHILGSDVHSLGRIADRGLYVVTAAVDRFVVLATVGEVF